MDNNANFGSYLYNHQQQQQQQQQSQPQPGQQPPQSGLASFGNLSAAQQQLQQDNAHPTLPPMQQPGQNGYSFGSLSYAGHPSVPGGQSHTPNTPHTPATSSMSAGTANAYSHMSPSNLQQGSMPPPSSFNAPYLSQGLMYQSSSGAVMPSGTVAVGLPTIRPMPPGGVSNPMNGLPSMSAAGQLGGHQQQSAFVQNEEAPTHVVGSQGRRGILPSAPGRPSAPTGGASGGTKSMIPQKDGDGKYLCPHCTKTYLHAKHLKRHLLRHTGDRPYMCHLCKDTFSRSDILKRHFQKCSIRRGNPTGANHLAHQRRNTNGSNRLSISQTDGPIGLAGMAEAAGSSYAQSAIGNSPTVNGGDTSARSSRANSIIAPGTLSQRGSTAGLGILSSNPTHSEPLATSAGYQQGLPAYSNTGQMQPNYTFGQQQMNGNGNVYGNHTMSFLGQTSSRLNNNNNNNNNHSSNIHQQNANGDGNGFDWSRMFSESGQDGFVGSQPANASSSVHIKTEPDTKQNFNLQHEESFLGSLYSHPGAFGSEYTENEHGIPGFPNWNTDDPLQAKIDSLLHYCFPTGADAVQGNQAAELVKSCLTSESIKHFADHYTSYHGHWPVLHMPTFKLTAANNALVMTIICIGAVYSPRLNVRQVRQMMEFVRATVVSNSSIHSRTINGQNDGLGSSAWDIEELQALLMLQILFTWHGEPSHRQAVRNHFPTLVRIAKTMNLFQGVGPSHYAYSVLHASQNTQSPPVDGRSFNWHSWLEQEKRNRVLYLLYLADAANAIFFNCMAQIDPFDIRLMLPSDDAAWDARDQQECASALGLNGPHNQGKNLNGTRRPRQSCVRDAMRILMEPTATFQPGETNVYSKFILIHAVVVRIIACQKTLLQPDGPHQGIDFCPSGSGPATPLSQSDWLDQHSNSGSISAGNSGHVTPTDTFGPSIQNVAAHLEKKKLTYALDKWKRNWDIDIELQYPPTQIQMRRFGFSRDPSHFFYLGRSYLQSQRAADWTASPDARFKQALALLKRIKGFVVGDTETKGQEIGSVGDIDDYGLDDLTLDMKLLFKPYNSQIDSPVAGVQTNSL